MSSKSRFRLRFVLGAAGSVRAPVTAGATGPVGSAGIGVTGPVCAHPLATIAAIENIRVIELDL